MRKPIYALSLCAATLVLMAGRCSDDDEKAAKPAAVEPSDGGVIDDKGTDAPGANLDEAKAAKEGSGGKDPSTKEPDEVFKDPLDATDAGVLPGGDDLGGAAPPAAGSDTFLDDPSFEPEAPPAQGD
jgi:hypothetical protein